MSLMSFCLQSDVRVLGDPESFLAKLLIGGGLLTLLVLLIWGPLLIIALLNTTNVSNPPTEVTIQLSVRSFEVSTQCLLMWSMGFVNNLKARDVSDDFIELLTLCVCVCVCVLCV